MFKWQNKLACSLLFLCSLFIPETAPALETKEGVLALGAGSLAATQTAKFSLSKLEKKHALTEKLRTWEIKDKALWDALEKRNNLRSQIQFMRSYSGTYNRRLMRNYELKAKEYLAADEEFRRLVKETSRTRVIDFTLGEFTGERRSLVNKYLLAKGLGFLGKAGGLTAAFQASYLAASAVLENQVNQKELRPNPADQSSPDVRPESAK